MTRELQAAIQEFESTTSSKVVYAKEALPTKVVKSIFLAGPTPRDQNVPSWRPEALKVLNSLGYDGHVFVPEPSSKNFTGDYADQVEWETAALNMADVIVFWVPRNMRTMPALTTNVEFGTWLNSGKAVLGYPSGAVSVRYLQHMADKAKVPSSKTLTATLTHALEIIGKGAPRVEGECQVPLLVWNNGTFQSWYGSQKKAGNKLLKSKVLWTFRVGPSKNKVFSWVLHVHVWIKDEDRVKSNEFVLARSDLAACVLHHEDQVVLVREFRSPVRNDSGFVYELAGGSSLKEDQEPQKVISHEVEEETGLQLDPSRFIRHETRQAVATLSAHVVHLFSAELTADEISQLKADVGNSHGVVEDTERTYVEVWNLKDIVVEQLVDWTNLGMILSVLRSKNLQT